MQTTFQANPDSGRSPVLLSYKKDAETMYPERCRPQPTPKEAIYAGKKYFFYSVGGAFLGLFLFFVLFHYSDTLAFRAGGKDAETMYPERCRPQPTLMSQQ